MKLSQFTLKIRWEVVDGMFADGILFLVGNDKMFCTGHRAEHD